MKATEAKELAQEREETDIAFRRKAMVSFHEGRVAGLNSARDALKDGAASHELVEAIEELADEAIKDVMKYRIGQD